LRVSDPTFFGPPAILSLASIVALTGAAVEEGADATRSISGISSLDRAGPHDVAFIDSPRFVSALAGTRAGACFCNVRYRSAVPAGTVALVTPEPHRAFARVAAALYPSAGRPQPVLGTSGVSPAAIVHPTAALEADVVVEPFAIVAAGAEIGRGTLIGPGAVIGPGVRIGRDVVIAAHVTIIHALIGNRVVIHPGARLGQDGFGFVPGGAGHTKIVQIGRVIIQDDVEIGANTTIDRGSNRDTVVGEGTKIDNQVQIGHNCVIGRHCLIAGQVGISGSVTIGDFVMLGGHAGIRDNVKIGNGALVAAAAGVGSDIPPGERWVGTPARPMAEWLSELKALKRLGGRRRNVREGGEGEPSDG
jgi:UDP-3-O-[3-hydroxymyristoyl] glucosamine N-acyltransferase